MVQRSLKLIVAVAMAVLVANPANASGGRAFQRSVADRSPRTAGGRLVVIPSRRGALLQPTSRSRREPFTTVYGSGRLETAKGTYAIGIQAVHLDFPGFRGTEIFVSFGRGFGSVHGQHARFATQDHGYDSWIRSPAAFTWSGQLTSGAIDTGDALHRWGRIDLRFVPTAPLRSGCHGDTAWRSGKLVGRFEFTPRHDNGFFGTVERARFGHARLSTSTCRHRFPTGGGRACPTQPTMVDATVGPDEHSFEDFFASSLSDGDTFSSAIQQQFYGSMSVSHEIFVWSGGMTRIRDRGDAVEVSVRAKRVGLVGALTATPSGGTDTSRPFPCGEGQQVIFEHVGATLTSGPGRPLTADFDTGAVTFREDSDARITRQIVSAA